MKPILFNTDMVRALLEGRKTVTRRVVKGAKSYWTLDHLGDHEAMTKVRANGEEYPVEVYGLWATFEQDGCPEFPMVKAPYQPSDILWVRETWVKIDGGFIYKANLDTSSWRARFIENQIGWHPSIHMPKEAARLFLRVTGVRVERLQDGFFTQGDTIAALCVEGIEIGDQCCQCIENYGNPCCNDLDPALEPDENGEDENGGSECGMLDEVRSDFARLWDSTIKPTDLPRCGWEANPWVWVIEFERVSKEAAIGGGGNGS